MNGILPRRFSPTSRWEDIGAHRMNAWLDATKRHGADIASLWELVHRLLRERPIVEGPASVATGFGWAAVKTWQDADTLTAIVHTADGSGGWYNAEEIIVAKPEHLRRTPYHGQSNAPGDGYWYEYEAHNTTRKSYNVLQPADVITQVVTPSYYLGAIIRIQKTWPHVAGATGIEWLDITPRQWARV